MIAVSILGLLGIFSLGFFISDVFLGKKSHVLERISVGFLLGSGLFTFVLFLANWWLRIPFGTNYSLMILLFLNIVAFILNVLVKKIKKEKKLFDYNLNFKEGFENLSKIEKITIFIILFLFLSSLIHNVFWPVADWDALALYDFRAKAFLIDTNLVHAALSNGYFIQYPLLTSLIHLFVYQIGIKNPSFIYSLFYLSFIAIFYYSLRRNVSRKKAMIFTTILSLAPEMFSNATMAYTNLPYTVYLCSGTFYLYDWIKKKEHSSLILSAILVGMSSWVRITETFWLAPLLVVFIVALKNKKWKEFIYYLVIIFVFYEPWKFFMSYISKITTPSSGAAVGLSYLGILKEINLGRILLVTNYLYRYVFTTWGLIFLVFILVIIKAAINWKKNNNKFLYITLLFFALLFVGILYFSITFSGWQDIPDSARRMSMFLVPLMCFCMALQI